MTFTALGGFGSLEGSAFDFQYMSRRTGEPGTSGWSSHGINPLGRGSTFRAADATASTYVNGFTSDLSSGVYKAWRPLVDAPNISEVSNLYRITGLDGRPRTVQLLTSSVNPVPPEWFTAFSGLFLNAMTAQIQPQLAGVSSDCHACGVPVGVGSDVGRAGVSGWFCCVGRGWVSGEVV